MDTITKLCSWYERQCVDDWHEEFGVKISTLDNPGWYLKVDLKGTALEGKDFPEFQTDRSDRDWATARRSGNTFEAFGGPNNLNEMIESFLAWAEE